MKTGNTGGRRQRRDVLHSASMEPGHEDREYGTRPCNWRHVKPASMEPGHEDREYPPAANLGVLRIACLNGARS